MSERQKRKTKQMKIVERYFMPANSDLEFCLLFNNYLRDSQHAIGNTETGL